MKRREPAASTPDLGPATVAILLARWSADPPADVPRELGFSAGFLELYNIGGIAKLWRAHEGWLREQARAWNRAPTFMLDRVPMYYAEYVVAAGGED